jgi:hypothetical protein
MRLPSPAHARHSGVTNPTVERRGVAVQLSNSLAHCQDCISDHAITSEAPEFP